MNIKNLAIKENLSKIKNVYKLHVDCHDEVHIERQPVVYINKKYCYLAVNKSECLWPIDTSRIELNTGSFFEYYKKDSSFRPYTKRGICQDRYFTKKKDAETVKEFIENYIKNYNKVQGEIKEKERKEKLKEEFLILKIKLEKEGLLEPREVYFNE